MKTLIYSIAGDIHASAVKWAMRQRGHDVRIILTGRFPIDVQSLIILNSRKNNSLYWEGEEFYNWKADAVWNRRFSSPTISNSTHPADEGFARQECGEYMDAFFSLARNSAFEVNPLINQRKASLKPIQLLVASQAELLIPNTIISNSPDDVRACFREQNEQVVFKSCVPQCWKSDGGVASNVTARIGSADLLDEEAINSASGIYQRLIEKHREYRVTIMGDKVFVAIPVGISSNHVDTRIGCRSFADGTKYFPKNVIEKCFVMMEKLGICFGCFDFIEETEGSEPQFLEVNEMGQWLAIEKHLPQFSLLENFCGLLESTETTFKGIVSNGISSYNAFRNAPEYNSALEQVREMYNLLSRRQVTIE